MAEYLLGCFVAVTLAASVMFAMGSIVFFLTATGT